MNTITLHSYRPGILGEVVRHHGIYYLKHWDFDIRFETQVARELAEFISQLDPARDGFWWAAEDDKFVGAIAVDGTSTAEGQARLRWFIVPEEFQGKGVGLKLFDRAMQFCRDKDYDSVHLWTFKGLVGARKLYEGAGMKVVEEHTVAMWGPEINAQKFELFL